MRGVGYYVKDLKLHLRQILGLDRKLRVAVLGAGNLGLALADYPGFRPRGLRDRRALRQRRREDWRRVASAACPSTTSRTCARCCAASAWTSCVLAVPAESAQHVLDQVTGSGVKAVLNFSPGTLKVPAGIKLKSVDLTVSLESLSFFLAHGDADV